MWQENPPTHDPEDPSYFIPNESASHKFIDPEEQKKKKEITGKKKSKSTETSKKKKRTDATSVPPIGPATPVTCTTPVGPATPVTCTTPVGPVTPVTCTTPVTPVTQKGRGKGKGKSSTPKTSFVVTPNPNDYGPLVLDAIEKALLETEVPNIMMYNNRIQGCYYKECCHRWDSMFMIPPINFRMKTYREYTRKSDGVQVKNTYKGNAFYCLETLDCAHAVNKGTCKNHIYMSNFYFQSCTGHVAVLKELGYWDHILANHAHITADGPKALGGMPAIYEY